ncbi:hypothetical protein DITRI_Ditri01bG0148800 [Diplodiscus trichospermus]
MEIKLNVMALSLLLLIASNAKAQFSNGVFDVMKYEAKANADISLALMRALFLAPVEVQVGGKLKAPADPRKFNDTSWVTFEAIDHKHITISRVASGPGHGISVRSLGKSKDEHVVGITVVNCTLINTMNGVRVKTWPASLEGVAVDMHFEDIIMVNVSSPILIDQGYSPHKY